MAISPQLRQFKSSGVYRLEFDKSQTSNINVGTLRLLVGHSKVGPYNTPVLIENVEDFKNVFGGIDKQLEKAGIFFHRSCLAALARGPILALSLQDVTNDTAHYFEARTDGATNTGNTNSYTTNSDDYGNFHDMDKFMKPTDTALLAVANPADTHCISFVNLKDKDITIIGRLAQEVDGFEITAEEWYGTGNVPTYLHDKDYLSDFMIDIYVFKGTFDPAVLDTDPVFGTYFSATGLDKTKLDEFSNLRNVSLLAKYTGSLLPGFKDMEGRNVYIESMINAEARRTGLFCAIDEDEVLGGIGSNSIDSVGHGATGNIYTSFLSYDDVQRQATLSGDVDENTVIVFDNDVSGTPQCTITYDTSITTPTLDIAKGDYLPADSTNYPNRMAKVVQVVKVEGGGATVLTIKTDIPVDQTLILLLDDMDTVAITATTVSVDYVAAAATIEVASASGWINGGTGTLTFDDGTNSETIAYTSVDTATGIVTLAAGGLTNGYLVATPTNVTGTYNDAGSIETLNYYQGFESAATEYAPISIGGATFATATPTTCLGMLSGTGLAGALADKDMIDFRYIVDTFGSDGLLTKSQLSNLARDRQNASAILNAPTVAEFKNSTDPSFKNSDGIFKTSYLKDGGNLDLNPTTLYALPGITDGANYAFYYGPGLLVKDNGKNIVVPPAAYVSNNYIDKYTAATPWSIIAGPRRGVVSGPGVVGAEYTFDKDDRDVLEPFGINPIVFQRGVGLTILGNKTGQQSIKSALSSAHVREVLIYIQNGIADILKDYVFEFNTVQTRLEIKTLVDSFLESVKQDGGVYDFKNIMDSSNNDNEVIDNNMGIVDTYVEPVKGLEIVVHRTTVLNTGEIATGSFL